MNDLSNLPGGSQVIHADATKFQTVYQTPNGAPKTLGDSNLPNDSGDAKGVHMVTTTPAQAAVSTSNAQPQFQIIQQQPQQQSTGQIIIQQQGGQRHVVLPGGQRVPVQVIRPGQAIRPGQVMRPGQVIRQGQVVRPGQVMLPGQVIRPGQVIQSAGGQMIIQQRQQGQAQPQLVKVIRAQQPGQVIVQRQPTGQVIQSKPAQVIQNKPGQVIQSKPGQVTLQKTQAGLVMVQKQPGQVTAQNQDAGKVILQRLPSGQVIVQQQQHAQQQQQQTVIVQNSSQQQAQIQQQQQQQQQQQHNASLQQVVSSQPSESVQQLQEPGSDPSSAAQAEEEPQVDIDINNVVCSFSTRCHLNLKRVATEGANVIFKRENGMVNMKLRNPKVTASIWSSGKITCTGATSEESAKIAARRVSRILQKMGFRIRMCNFRVVNVLGTCALPFGIRITHFSNEHRENASYEPELHPGVTYRIKEPKATLKIFSTGSITVTAPRVSNIGSAIEHIYPLVFPYKMERSKKPPKGKVHEYEAPTRKPRPPPQPYKRARLDDPSDEEDDDEYDEEFDSEYDSEESDEALYATTT